MAKIYGDQENIKYARSAPAGARDVYVNMDAINDLPEEYEATINCVEYDPKRLADSFSNVGTEKSPSWDAKARVYVQGCRGDWHQRSWYL